MSARRRRWVVAVLITITAVIVVVAAVFSQGAGPSERHPRSSATAKAHHRQGSGRSGIEEVSVPLVDPSRPTVAYGTEISSSRALTTLVWLPSVPGRRPLIVFAPGFAVGPGPYESLLEAWARAGYVVAAIEFPLTDAAVAGPNLDEADLQNQPLDVDFVAGALLEPASPVRSSIDSSRIALAGHSDGGESVLAASFDNGAPGTPPFQAVIAMSVRPLVTLAAPRNPPLLVTQGDADATDPASNGRQAFAAAGAPKYLTMINGGGHLQPLEVGSPWFEALVKLTTAFWNLYLGDRGSSGTIVAAGNVTGLSTTPGQSPSPQPAGSPSG